VTFAVDYGLYDGSSLVGCGVFRLRCDPLVVTAVEPGRPDSEFARPRQLRPNVPNPFNPSTEIGYRIESEQFVDLRIVDPRGRTVRRLVSGFRPAGDHRVQWDATDDRGVAVASGSYLYVLSTETTREARKLVVVK